MKVASDYSEVKTSNCYKQFSFSNSPTVFRILSDSLYKNKIGSIIRELCSNAKDSHIAAGKSDIPFEVILPVKCKIFSNESPQFKVIDHGIGLSEEDIYKIYTVYGESNKSNSNDYIGGFGIGSKSPFSYTDEFQIISTYNGIKTCYCAFINSEGFPSITKLYSEKTDNDNGIEISLNVDEKDISEFDDEYAKQIKCFNPKPICNKNINFDIEKPDIIRSFWEYTRTNYKFSIAVKISDIEYPISLNEVFQNNENPIDFFDYGTKIVFNVPIGSVDLVASRESLSYTEKTKDYIKDCCSKFIEELKEYLIEYSKNVSEYERSKYAFYLRIPVSKLQLKEFGYFSKLTIPRYELEKICNEKKVQIYLKNRGTRKLYNLFKFCDLTENGSEFIIYPKDYSFYKIKNTVKNSDIVNVSKSDIIIIKYSLSSDVDDILKLFKNPKCEELNVNESTFQYDKRYTIRHGTRFYNNISSYSIKGGYSIDKLYDEIISNPKTLILASKGNDIIYHQDLKYNKYSLIDIKTKLHFIFANNIYYNKVIILPISTINDLKKYKGYSYMSCDEFYNTITDVAKSVNKVSLSQSDKDNYLFAIALYDSRFKKIFNNFSILYTANEIKELIHVHKIFELFNIYLTYNNSFIRSYLSIFTDETTMESYRKKVKIYESIISKTPILELAENTYCGKDNSELMKKCIKLYSSVC